MSSSRDASDHFPLHLLVWNNDYRQLEKELRGQVRNGAGGLGWSSRFPEPLLFPFPAILPGDGADGLSFAVLECLLFARPCVEGAYWTIVPPNLWKSAAVGAGVTILPYREGRKLRLPTPPPSNKIKWEGCVCVWGGCL